MYFATLSTGKRSRTRATCRKGLQAHQGAFPDEGPAQEGQPSAQTGGYRVGKSASQGAQPAAELSSSTVPSSGERVRADGDGRPVHPEHDGTARNPSQTPSKEGQYLPNGAAAKAGLNQSILDAGWGQFQSFCLVKAERAGRRVVLVDPYNTSQLCSQCGASCPKT